MDSARWERIQEVFHDAAARPESARPQFLEAVCGDDAELMARVRAMLAADARRDLLLDRGLPDIAYRLLGAPLESFPLEDVGPYRLKKILGQGGMGVVCLAEREDTGAPVAIKFLLHAGMSAPRRESFAGEIKTLARLKHPFIARLYDAGELADGTPWFVMEYVEGVRLTDYCRQKAPRIDERLRLFRAVCDAVQYAYRQGIIHCDLKPSNILVDKEGTPRLLDFGVARQLQNPDEAANEPPSGLRFGSPEYAAPEWARDGTVGSYTDVYSLGIILYEILTGRLPVMAGANQPDKPSLSAIRTAGFSSAGKAAWRDLDALCLKALNRDAGQRYQSVEELIRDIDHYLGCRPLEARPGGFTYRADKFIRRNRRTVATATAMLTMAVVLVVFFTIRLAQAKNAALAEAALTRRIQRLMLNLFDAGDKAAAPANDLRVATLLDRGALEAKSLNTDPATQAELCLTLGTMYELLGSYQKADELLRLAVEKNKASLGPEDPKTASALVQLALLRGDQARLEDAERLARQGLDIARRHLPPSDLRVLDAESALGRVLAQRGANDKAIAVLEPVVRLRPSGEEGTVLFLESLTALGYAQHNAGHYEAAESINRRALALDRQLHGTSHPRIAQDLINIGASEIALGRAQEAESAYREALRIETAWYGARHPTAVSMTSLLARVLLMLHQDAEAQTLLQQVLTAQEQDYGPDHPYVAFTLDTLGRLALRRGKLKAAEADLRRALAINRSLYGDANYQSAMVHADLADVFLAEKQYARAEEIFRSTLKVLTDKQPPGSFSAGLMQVKLGRTLLRQERYEESERYLTGGYVILMKQPRTFSEQIEETRKDLALVYHELHQDGKAIEFRAQSASVNR